MSDGISTPVDDFPYTEAMASFDLSALNGTLAGKLDVGINACFECCDRHAGSSKIALDWENQYGHRASYTFEELQSLSARFANLLTAVGVVPGDVVAGLLPRTPELVVTILGTWRAGAVYQPLFTAFGPKAIEHRLATSQAKLVVTDVTNRPKLDDIPQRPTTLVVGWGEEGEGNDDVDFWQEMKRRSPIFAPILRRGGDLMMLMSTSGTTGLPKGVPVPLTALLAIYAYMRDAIGLREDDRFWNIADPGWAYGLYYSITGPLLLGHTMTLYDGPFTVDGTYGIIASHRITNLAGSPTAFRMLVAAGPEAAAVAKGRLRVISSAGEPLNPEVVRWFRQHLSIPIFDHYGQTEVGMVVNNHHRLVHTVIPGSAGLPMPGFSIVVLGDDDKPVPSGTAGTLSIDVARSPLFWFMGYLNQPTPALSGGYYRTGDTVEIGADGHVFFVGRNDDVITSSGYRIGPFDVESALIEHPAVLEAAVIGKPDPDRTEIVKAFVVLTSGVVGSSELVEELRQHVRNRLSAHAYPREIAFVADLPKTPSGKIQRFTLRNAEKPASNV